MSSALATLAPAEIQSPAPRGSGIGQQTLAGCVSAFFALHGYDRRSRVATYALRVVNRTTSSLICRTLVVSRRGDAVLAHPIFVEVAPLSTSVAQLPVWTADFHSFDRAVAEIAGDGVHCIVEAPAPERPRTRRTLALLAAATAIAGGILLASAAALDAALPRVNAFSLAPQALPGTTVRAEYVVSGSGALGYSVLAPDGRQIQGGPLGAHEGAIAIAIPPSNAQGAYTVQLALYGPLGTATATRVLNAIDARSSTQAQIDAVSVKPAVARPGETVNVAYAATGESGYVRLLGSDGTIWQQQPFSRSGTTQFVVPPVPGLRDMRVLIHVTKGSSVAQSMAGLAVVSDANTPSLQEEGPQSAQAAADDDPAAPGTGNAAESNATFEVVDSSVKSGATIHVRIISPRNGMRIALTDDTSHELSAVEVASDATAITLRAPVVYAPTKYTVVATFTDGFGQESVVQPVTVVP